MIGQEKIPLFFFLFCALGVFLGGLLILKRHGFPIIDGGRRRIIFWAALIGLLGLVIGAAGSDYFGQRESNLIEVTRIVEVTREIIVERPVTRTVIETQVIEPTQEVALVTDSPRNDALSNLSGDGPASEATGSIIIGVLENDGRASLGTHTVAIFPKTLIDDSGEAQPNRAQEIKVPVDLETGFAEAYGLPAGTYTACLKSLFHNATVGEIKISAGEITRINLRWPDGVLRIGIECFL